MRHEGREPLLDKAGPIGHWAPLLASRGDPWAPVCTSPPCTPGSGTPGLRRNSDVQGGSWETALGVTSFHEIQGPEQTVQTPHQPWARMPLTLQSMASMQHRITTRSLIADLRDEFKQLACPGLGGARYSSYQGASSVQTRTCWAERAPPRPGPPTPRRGLSHSRPHSSQSGRGAHTHRPSLCPPLPPAQSAAVSGCLVAKALLDSSADHRSLPGGCPGPAWVGAGLMVWTLWKYPLTPCPEVTEETTGNLLR